MATSWTILYFLNYKGRSYYDIFEPIQFGFFKLGARFDFTVVMHLSAAFLLCLIHPLISIGVMLLLEIRDGFVSEQGFDLVDLTFGNAIGVAIWFESGMTSLITFV